MEALFVQMGSEELRHIVEAKVGHIDDKAMFRFETLCGLPCVTAKKAPHPPDKGVVLCPICVRKGIK